jgi:hypothetical protein
MVSLTEDFGLRDLKVSPQGVVVCSCRRKVNDSNIFGWKSHNSIMTSRSNMQIWLIEYYPN